MPRVVQPATCPACDGEFIPNRSNPRLRVATQIYCSRQCQAGMRHVRASLGRRPTSMYRSSAGRRFYIPAARESRLCEQCDQRYVPKRREGRNRFCSRRCKDLARFAKPGERPCGSCGQDFTPKRNAYAAFCSKACRQRARRAAMDGPRRAIKTRVAERDHWRCGICQEPVDRQLRFPDPLSASVDHVVLVANGGSNDPSNLRLAHLGCNMRRGGWTERGRYARPDAAGGAVP